MVALHISHITSLCVLCDMRHTHATMTVHIPRTRRLNVIASLSEDAELYLDVDGLTEEDAKVLSGSDISRRQCGKILRRYLNAESLEYAMQLSLLCGGMGSVTLRPGVDTPFANGDAAQNMHKGLDGAVTVKFTPDPVNTAPPVHYINQCQWAYSFPDSEIGVLCCGAVDDDVRLAAMTTFPSAYALMPVDMPYVMNVVICTPEYDGTIFEGEGRTMTGVDVVRDTSRATTRPRQCCSTIITNGTLKQFAFVVHGTPSNMKFTEDSFADDGLIRFVRAWAACFPKGALTSPQMAAEKTCAAIVYHFVCTGAALLQGCHEDGISVSKTGVVTLTLHLQSIYDTLAVVADKTAMSELLAGQSAGCMYMTGFSNKPVAAHTGLYEFVRTQTAKQCALEGRKGVTDSNLGSCVIGVFHGTAEAQP